MAATDWSKWDEKVDVEGLRKDVEEAKENGGSGNYVEVPDGEYEVKVTKLELVPTKKDKNPMVTCWFEVLTGEFKGQKIFMNQVITQGWQIHKMNEFLRQLDSGVVIEGFDTYSNYANMLMDIHEAIDNKLEYALEYGHDSKGFGTYEIVEIFEVA